MQVSQSHLPHVAHPMRSLLQTLQSTWWQLVHASSSRQSLHAVRPHCGHPAISPDGPPLLGRTRQPSQTTPLHSSHSKRLSHSWHSSPPPCRTSGPGRVLPWHVLHSRDVSQPLCVREDWLYSEDQACAAFVQPTLWHLEQLRKDERRATHSCACIPNSPTDWVPSVVQLEQMATSTSACECSASRRLCSTVRACPMMTPASSVEVNSSPTLTDGTSWQPKRRISLRCGSSSSCETIEARMRGQNVMLTDSRRRCCSRPTNATCVHLSRPLTVTVRSWPCAYPIKRRTCASPIRL